MTLYDLMHFQLWDASTGQEFSQFTEHEKRAWSVDFSAVCPTKFASGSDDCTVKLWSISEVNPLFHVQTHTYTLHYTYACKHVDVQILLDLKLVTREKETRVTM